MSKQSMTARRSAPGSPSRMRRVAPTWRHAGWSPRPLPARPPETVPASEPRPTRGRGSTSFHAHPAARAAVRGKNLAPRGNVSSVTSVRVVESSTNFTVSHLDQESSHEQRFDAPTTAIDDISGDYTLDVSHSRLGFVARHAMVTKVRGQFGAFEGTARIDEANPAASKVDLTIQVASSTPVAPTATATSPRRLLRRRDLPLDHLLLHRRHPRRLGLEHHRRPDHQGRHQVGDHRVRADRLRARPLRQPACRLRGETTINRKDWGSPGTPPSRPAACSSRRRSSSSSTSPRSRTPEPAGRTARRPRPSRRSDPHPRDPSAGSLHVRRRTRSQEALTRGPYGGSTVNHLGPSRR